MRYLTKKGRILATLENGKTNWISGYKMEERRDETRSEKVEEKQKLASFPPSFPPLPLFSHRLERNLAKNRWPSETNDADTRISAL